jgi:hypothetical protein
MRVLLKKKTPGQIEFGIIYGGIALIALAVARFMPSVTTALPSCVFSGVTGIPCPACGSTRSAVHLAQGDVITSLCMNPLTSIILIAAILYFFYSALTLLSKTQRVTVSLSDREKDGLRLLIIIVAMLNWAYLMFTL